MVVHAENIELLTFSKSCLRRTNKNKILSHGDNMFRKKRLYKIVYKMLCYYTTIIEAKDEIQAIRKFNRKMSDKLYSIVSFEEYKVEQ